MSSIHELAAAQAKAEALRAESTAFAALQEQIQYPEAPPEVLLGVAADYVKTRIDYETIQGVPPVLNAPALKKLTDPQPQVVADMFTQLSLHAGRIARIETVMAIINMIFLSPFI